MDASKPIGAAEFVKQSGVVTPGYRASGLVKSMQDEYRTTGNKFLRRDYQVGNFYIQLDFNGERNWVKIDVWAAGFPDYVYDYFYSEHKTDFNKRVTRRSNSISAENTAKVMASVNSLYRKSQSDVAKVMLVADIRKEVEALRRSGKVKEEVLQAWNQEAKDLGMFSQGGLLGINTQQAKTLRAWFNGKIKTLAPKQEATADQIVDALLCL